VGKEYFHAKTKAKIGYSTMDPGLGFAAGDQIDWLPANPDPETNGDTDLEAAPNTIANSNTRTIPNAVVNLDARADPNTAPPRKTGHRSRWQNHDGWRQKNRDSRKRAGSKGI
jgi:hypothetical protein